MVIGAKLCSGVSALVEQFRGQSKHVRDSMEIESITRFLNLCTMAACDASGRSGSHRTAGDAANPNPNPAQLLRLPSVTHTALSPKVTPNEFLMAVARPPFYRQ